MDSTRPWYILEVSGTSCHSLKIMGWSFLGAELVPEMCSIRLWTVMLIKPLDFGLVTQTLVLLEDAIVIRENIHAWRDIQHSVLNGVLQNKCACCSSVFCSQICHHSLPWFMEFIYVPDIHILWRGMDIQHLVTYIWLHHFL